MDNKEITNEENIETIEETEEQEENEQEVFTYKVDNNNINNDYNRNSYDNNKSFIYILIGIVVLIAIIVILIVFVNKGSSKKSSYTDIEETMVKGAQNYYKKYSNELPEISKQINIDTLVQNNFMKPLSEMVDSNTTCTGYVTVSKSNDEYTYFPMLDCGEKYKSQTLTNKIITTSTVTSGDGLYEENGEYRFRGEYPNNYVAFDNKEWRIIKINNDSSIKMIMINQKFEKTVWDDRYNSSKGDYSGINDFKVSRMLETLNNMYKDDNIISKNNKKLLVKHNWCIGKLTENNIPINNMNLCSETYDDLYIGAIEADEVLKASIASNCVNMYDSECTNYNYFININSGWTLNASSDKTYNVFSSSNASISYKRASNSSYIRPVININSNVLYKSGDGTKENPYKFSK